jgi:ArsR family transcriptional regulator, arsenate/arsenite/antimonite-responsive transcriptional repressor
MAEITESEVALIGKALGDPNRLAIYTQVANCSSELFCGEIECKHKISPATLSHHLKILHDLGLITSRKEGLHVYYKPIPERLTSYLAYLSKVCKRPKPLRKTSKK